MFSKGDKVQHKDGTIGYVLNDFGKLQPDVPYVTWTDEIDDKIWASLAEDLKLIEKFAAIE